MNIQRLWKNWSGYLFLAPYAVLFCAFLALPLGYGLVLSCFQWEMLCAAPPRFVGMGNYAEALQNEYFRESLWATFRFTFMAVPLTVSAALLIALGINNVNGKRRAFYRAAYFAPAVVSISVAGLIWRFFYQGEFGMFNAWLAPWGWHVPWLTDTSLAMKSIVLMTLWWTVGGPLVILLAGLHQIPKQLYEAAAIDGANAWHRFRHITLPQLRPVLLFVSIMNIIGSFQVFGQVFMITRGGPEQSTRVLVQYIYETAFTHYRMGYGAAMSWLLFLCIAFFSVIQFRLMREK